MFGVEVGLRFNLKYAKQALSQVICLKFANPTDGKPLIAANSFDETGLGRLAPSAVKLLPARQVGQTLCPEHLFGEGKMFNLNATEEETRQAVLDTYRSMVDSLALGRKATGFFFGSPCELCQRGNHFHRWTRYDGTGSWRMHEIWVGPEHDWLFDYGSQFCARNGWFSRHWIMTAAIFGLPALVGLMALLDLISEACRLDIR